jgi:sulfatase maturation enzyme AslB (radical SAM superfamily)
MIDLGNDLGVDYIQFRPTIIYDQEHPAHRAENTSWMSDAIKLMESNQYDRKLIVDLDRFRDYQNWTAHNYEICWWSGIQTVITPNGKVWTCVNKREYTGALLGDLTTESFSNVWKRRRIAHVDADCRIMCRGYPANRILNEIMAPNDHANFI